MLRYLGEIDCYGDLAEIIGEEEAMKSFRGKLNYFQDLDSGIVFGASDYATDYIFQENDVV